MPAPSPTPAGPEAEEIPDEVPETTSVEQLDRWLRKLDAALERAETAQNLAAVASLAQKYGMLMALRHRMTPLPKPDPNDNPDFRALARQGEERLLKRVRDFFTPAK